MEPKKDTKRLFGERENETTSSEKSEKGSFEIPNDGKRLVAKSLFSKDDSPETESRGTFNDESDDAKTDFAMPSPLLEARKQEEDQTLQESDDDLMENSDTEIGSVSPLVSTGELFGGKGTNNAKSMVSFGNLRTSDSSAYENTIAFESEPGGDSLVFEEDGVDNLEIGELLLEKYRIESCIGAGGFGIVYKAINLETDELVAIKTLRRSLPEYKVAERRFEREIALTRSLNSPHTLRVLDFGKSNRNIHFFVMELLSGQTIDEFLEGGRRYNFVELRNILLQVLDSLSEAHSNGIVHRDLKPSNIFLCESEKDEFNIKVLDFGIAKITDSGDEAYNEKLTRTGSSFGSPAYMSPEQVSSATIHPSSDIYALGLIMIELLTGCPVFQGNSALEVAVLQLAPVPVSIPEWISVSSFGEIIECCVRKDSQKRYQNANELLESIRLLDPKVLVQDYKKAQRSHFASTTPSQQASIASAFPSNTTSQIVQTGVNTKQILLAGGIIAIGLIIVIMLMVQLYLKKVVPSLAKNNVEEVVKPQTLPDSQKGILLSAASGAGSGAIELRRVELTIASSPPNARLIRVRDARDFGSTPVKLSLVRSAHQELYVVKLENHLDYELPLSSMRGETVAITLSPSTPTPVPSATPPKTPSTNTDTNTKDSTKPKVSATQPKTPKPTKTTTKSSDKPKSLRVD